MKSGYIFTLMIFHLVSCGNSIDKNMMLKETKDLMHQSLKSNIDKDSTSIHPLPFGPKIELENLNKAGAFYANLIGKHFFNNEIESDFKTYDLPDINEFRYLKINSNENYICENGLIIDSLFKISKYRYRLPNISGLQSYYMSNYSPVFEDYPELFKKYCRAFCFSAYGYLILYNANQKLANIIPIYYNTQGDGIFKFRNFYIDEKYNIYLVDGALIGEYEQNGVIQQDVSISKWNLITISEYGELNINVGKNYADLPLRKTEDRKH